MRKRRPQSGAALLLVIAVLAGLIAIVASFSATQIADFRASLHESERRRAQLYAEAGLERALAELTVPPTNPAATNLQDAWAQLGQFGSDRFLVGNGWFRVEIIDAGSLVNINTATEDQLLRLPITNEQLDCLMDWRDQEDMGRPEGAKDPFYNALENPYNAALRRLETLDELLLVKGFSAAALYQRQTETVNTQFLAPGGEEQQPVLAELITVRSTSQDLTPDGQAKLNVNTASVAQLTQRGIPQQTALAIVQRRNTQGTFERLGQVFQVPGVTIAIAPTILDNLTIGAAPTVEGRINLNTATEAVLNAVPGFTFDIAAGIVSRQSFGYNGLGELTQVPGITMEVLQQCADYVCVGAQTFLVRVIGGYGPATASLEATVVLDAGTPRVISRWRPPVSDPKVIWRWETATTSDVELGASR